MTRSIAMATILLVGVVRCALAQGGNPSPAPTGGQPVLGQTGTMHDGNNAQLQLAPERNPSWYEDRWAGYQLQPQSSWYFGAGDLWYAGRWIGYEPRVSSGAAAGGGQR
jgi:hypothetical protein